MEKRITDIHCPNCGSPARFDIIHQRYGCPFCGSLVEINEALQETQGFRKMRIDRLQKSREEYQLFSAVCEGCGAEVVFEEGEALSDCAFCGRSLVRGEYLKSEDFPENVIPFVLTRDEAQKRLREWCDSNRSRPEAGKLKEITDQLQGFYLPYELIDGPVHMTVGRMDGYRTYECEGFINEELVNRSSQLDNLLLDGMEPFDLDELEAFDFGYLAGQRVKIADISQQALEKRAREETAETYTPFAARVMESRAVEVTADVSDAIRLPVLLPVYYVCRDSLMAAVNGQSGKVSVRSLKKKRFYFLPWWLKAILATLAFSLIALAAFMGFGMDLGSALYIDGLLTVVFIIVILCLYSDTVHNRFIVETNHEIYTSGESNFRRCQGKLIPSDKVLQRKLEEPVFFEELDGRYWPVVLRFTTPLRVIGMILLCIGVLFLPVICALIVNGFDFRKLNLGGSAAWFCVVVPVVPICLLKFGIVELHDNPWIYQIREDGSKKRYRRKLNIRITPELIKDILRALFIPPVSLAVWFGIISFIVMVYLTAGGE
ncbi:MAG: zinc ribbon domain-containing protein [Erysipelotrichaceae bacterium]|nr:zinc ribbon domain-containing protein [Erysipelotrichaceae bacterium]